MIMMILAQMYPRKRMFLGTVKRTCHLSIKQHVPRRRSNANITFH